MGTELLAAIEAIIIVGDMKAPPLLLALLGPAIGALCSCVQPSPERLVGGFIEGCRNEVSYTTGDNPGGGLDRHLLLHRRQRQGGPERLMLHHWR